MKRITKEFYNQIKDAKGGRITQRTNGGETESDNNRIGSSVDSEKESLENYTVSEMIHIPKGETKEFVSKSLHISSTINCEGEIVLSNSIVYYNDSEYASKIILGESAVFKAKNCIFVCEDKDTRHFVSAKNAKSVAFENCDFRDCSYFLDGFSDEFKLNNCNLLNCAYGFIYIEVKSENVYTIKDNVIESKTLAPFNVLNDKEESTPLFTLYGKGSITNNRIEEYEEFRNLISFPIPLPFFSVSFEKMYTEWYFSADKCTLSQCEFYGASHCTNAQNISKCIFKNCNAPVYRIHDTTSIDDCVFEDCSDVIYCHTYQDEISEITNCKFISCQNKLIDGHFVDIKCCEFRNCEFLNYNRFFNEAAIVISNSGRNGSSTIESCVFDGCDAGEGFLIKGDVDEKPHETVLFVEKCDFKNCTTKRKDNKIIDVMASYYSVFNRKKSVQTTRLSGNRGAE